MMPRCELLREQRHSPATLRDERYAGEPLDVRLPVGTLRPDQEAAVAAMLRHDDAACCARRPPFGKTVTAAALIARRGVNTLVLVHRTELLKQWQERLARHS
jgi:superfamily II DNA or RNA helicase